jgi:hypothetical protein
MTVSPATLQVDRDRRPAGGILPLWIIATLAGGTMAAVGAAVALFRATGRDWWVLLRDPAAAFDFAPSAGLFSHLGVLAMAGMGAICLFSVLVLPRGAHDRGMLAYVGGLALLLAVDDLFMLHEGILPRVAGIPEHVTLGIYVALMLGLMWRIGGPLFTRDWLGFWVAAAFLVVMLGTDLLFEVATPASFLVEETAKLSGFVLWSAFWIACAGRAVRGQT